MGGILYPDAPHAWWVFLVLTVVLGGALAWATGRALAKTWRPYPQVLVYMLVLAAAVRFLHFALFAESLLDPVLYVSALVILAVLGSLGYRRMRALQMVTQYSFGFQPAGAFGWQSREVSRTVGS